MAALRIHDDVLRLRNQLSSSFYRNAMMLCSLDANKCGGCWGGGGGGGSFGNTTPYS